MQMTLCTAGTVWQTETRLLTILTCAPYIARKDDGTLDIEASEDGKTFTVHLNAPCAYFLDLCAFPAFYPVPQQAVEAADGADDQPRRMVHWKLVSYASGPMYCTEWKHNESMTYEKNPNYFDADKVSLKKINSC